MNKVLKSISILFLVVIPFILNADCLGAFQDSWNNADAVYASDIATCEGKSLMAEMLCRSEVTTARQVTRNGILANYELCEFNEK